METGFARKNVLAKGMICFVWDDGWQSHDIVADLANDLGQRHTFGIVSTLMNGTHPSYARPATVKSWFDAGHEIVSHSATHANMASISQSQRMVEFDASRADLEAVVGDGQVNTFMYPFGGTARNAQTDRELYLRYDRVLCTGPYIPIRWDTGDRDNEFLIHRSTWNGDPLNQQALLDQIRQCAEQPMILLTTGHDLGAVSAPSQAQVEEAMELAHSLGIPCVTVAEAFPKSTRLTNPGFEQVIGEAAVGWNYIKSSGAQTLRVVEDAPQAGLNGSRSLHMVTVADTGAFVYARHAAGVELRPGTKYKLSGVYRCTKTGGTGGFYPRILEHGIDEQISLGTVQPPAALTSSSWAPFVVEFTTNASTRFAYIDMLLNNCTGEAWVDHLDIRPARNGNFG